MFTSEIMIYNKLNDDILRIIWYYLKPNDICQLISVDKTAKKWCILINREIPQEFNLNLAVFDEKEKEKMICKVIDFFPNLSKVVFCSGTLNESLKVMFKSESVRNNIKELQVNILSDKAIEHIETLRKLQTLNISGSSISSRGFQRICFIDSITSLDISYCVHINVNVVSKYLHSLTNLAILSLRGNKELLDKDSSRLWFPTTVTSLDLSFCAIDGHNKLFYLYNLRTSLTFLNLRNNAHLGSMQYVSPLTALTFLDISNCGYYTNNFGLSFLSFLTRLTGLNIRSLPHISDESMSFISSLTNITFLNLSYCENIIDQGFSHLSSLHKLKHLDIEGCKTIDRALYYLSSLTNITSLNLQYCAITDEGFARISLLTCMTSLNLSRCRLTNLRMSYLSSLTELSILECERCEGMTDEGLSKISSLTKITKLNLSFCKITTISSLKDLTNITYLNLSDCDCLSNDGISCIAPMKTIKYLNLYSCKSLTDDALFHVCSLTNLKMLRIPCNNFHQSTDKILQNLLRQLPELESLFLYQINRYNNDDIVLSEDVFNKLVSIKYFDHEVGVSVDRRNNSYPSNGFKLVIHLRTLSKKQTYTAKYD